jgi:hypothetical protein
MCAKRADGLDRYYCILAGMDGLVLACEPTGRRWKPLVVTARARRIPVVCVQPLLVRRPRYCQASLGRAQMPRLCISSICWAVTSWRYSSCR